MKLVIEANAEAEAMHAIKHYEACRDGLGLDFSRELDAGFEWILQHPLAWPVFDEGARRCQLRRFPYVVVYRVMTDHITVLAVMHQHREPGYWMRLS